MYILPRHLSHLKIRLLLCGLIFFFCARSYAQGGQNPDSLKERYSNKDVPVSEKLKILKTLSFPSPNLQESLSWADSLMQFASRHGYPDYKIQAHLNKAYSYSDMGLYFQDIQETLKALEIADNNNLNPGRIYSHLAYAYGQVYDSEESRKNYHKAIYHLLSADPADHNQLAATYLNYSEYFFDNAPLDSAFYYIQKSKESTALADSLAVAHLPPLQEGNSGVYYLKKGQYEKAKPLLEKSAEGFRPTYPNASIEYYNHLTDLAQAQGDISMAREYTNKALDIARATKTTSELANTYLNLSEIETEVENFEAALQHHVRYKKYQDSLINMPSIQKMYNLNKEYEVASAQKETEIQQLRADRSSIISYVSVAVAALLSLLIFALFNRFKYIRKTSRIIEAEKERSDALLKNILPDETADELKAFGKVSAKQFDSVTVMFADFCGFTKYSSRMKPEELVERVDFYFSRFDEIMEKYDLEKIKTIGDAYMCAGGLPYTHNGHALRVVMAAFEMMEFVNNFKQEAPDDPTRFNIRIGINTGPVVAGVVGTKKFVYDIWGDTVNIASRMESNSEAGQINVSDDTYTLIQHTLKCNYRGEVDVKNKGMMKMYYVEPLTSAEKEALYSSMKPTD